MADPELHLRKGGEGEGTSNKRERGTCEKRGVEKTVQDGNNFTLWTFFSVQNKKK